MTTFVVCNECGNRWKVRHFLGFPFPPFAWGGFCSGLGQPGPSACVRACVLPLPAAGESAAVASWDILFAALLGMRHVNFRRPPSWRLGAGRRGLNLKCAQASVYCVHSAHYLHSCSSRKPLPCMTCLRRFLKTVDLVEKQEETT